MARDYSNRSNGGARGQGARNGGKAPNKTKRRPAVRPNRAKSRAAGGGPPGWIWLICGLCIGLTIAAGFYVFGRPAGDGMRQQVVVDTPAAGQNETAGEQPDDVSAEEEEQEPRFAFYKMLPDYEVVIPEEEYPEDNSGQAATSAEAAEPAAPQPTTPSVEEPGQYVIQAGSFSTYDDANRRKAELALLGMDAHIVSFDLNSGKTVYRVQSSTIESNSRLNELLKRLRENRIDTLVMRDKS